MQFKDSLPDMTIFCKKGKSLADVSILCTALGAYFFSPVKTHLLIFVVGG